MTVRGTPIPPNGSATFARDVLTLSTLALAAALAEAACLSIRSHGSVGFFWLVFGAFCWPAFALALGLAAGASTLRALARRLRAQGLLGSFDGYRALDAVAAASCVVPLAVLTAGHATLVLTSELHNRELAALVSAGVSLALAGLAVTLWIFLALVARSLRESHGAPLPLLPGTALSLGAFGWLFRHVGLNQLDPYLLAAPSAALVAIPGALRLRRWLAGHGVAPKKGLALVASLSVLSALVSLLGPPIAGPVSRAGAWSRPALSLLRHLTDFDHDGYSGLFGGGDCAPFDPEVHPGAREIPRDGIDNNCVGGDGGHARAFTAQKPRAGAVRLEGPRQNFVLVTIETLRADHVSFLGYHRPTTPELGELAKTSVVFERSYATTPTTRLSVAALLSGLLPSSIHWLNQSHERQMRRMAPDTPWLPALLAQQGYFTLAVHTNFRAFTPVENAGFDRGFVRYDTSTSFSYSGGTMHGFPGGAQVDRALSLLDEQAGRPLFLWLHLLEPHYLYEQSPDVPSFGSDELALYDAEIAEADRQIGRLLAGLKARNLFDTSVLLVTGDHGEEFGEHGQRWHGSNLFDPQVRTATLLRVPGLGARRVREATSFLDLAPTVLHLLGIEGGFERAMGRDLVPLLREGHPPEPGFLIENFKVDDGSQALLGVVEFPFKLVRSGSDDRLALYDLLQDPSETKDLWQPSDPVARRLAERLYGYLESGLARGVGQNQQP